MPDGSNFGNSLAPQRDIIAAFWSAFSPCDPVMRLGFLHHQRTRPPAEREGTLDELWPQIVESQEHGYEVYYFLNRINRGPGRGKGGAATDEDVAEIRALATDHDNGLPAEWHWHLLPRFIVHSSTTEDGVCKGQALWPVSDCPVAEFTQAQERLIAHYGSDRSIKDPKRILRLPGSLHQKNPARRQLVTFDILSDDPISTLAEITSGLPEISREKTRQQTDKASNSESRNVDLPTLATVLSYQSSAIPRAEWFPRIRAIAMTPLENDEDKTIRRRMAHDWMAGKGYRGDWIEPTDALYRTDAEINRAFDAEEKADGCGFGTLVYHARRDGWGSVTDIFRDRLCRDTDHPRGMGPRLNLMTIERVFAMPDPEELVSRMLMERENVCIVGAPKSGKTFIALDIALSLAAGQRVFDHQPVLRSGPVVYLSGEGHAGMKRRLKAWGLGRDVPDLETLPFYYNANVPMAEAGVQECQAFIDGIREIAGEPVLVVIDTMARSLGGLDENSAVAANQYLALTEGLRSGLDCTTLTLAHATNKTTNGGNPRPVDIRGSSGFAGGFDAVWTVQMNEANKTVKLAAKWVKDADLDDLGVFCFRLKPIEVEGMKHGKGGVLEFVPPSEFEQDQRSSEPQLRFAHICYVLKEAGCYGFKNGVTDEALATMLLPDADATSLAHEVKRLKNCRRATAAKTYKAIYREEVPEGSTKLAWRWCLPEEAGA